MIRTMKLVLLALAIAAIPVSAAAQSVSGRTTRDATTAQLEAQIKTAAVIVQTSQASLEVALQKYPPDHPTVQKARVELARAQEDYAAAEEMLAARKVCLGRERLLGVLQRPVDIRCREATVPQTAEVLSKVSGLSINVDPLIPQETRLSVEARTIPLAKVLEAIGLQATLMIAPDGSGIALKTWPSLKVGDQTEQFTGPLAPWSDEWGLPPTAAIEDLPSGGAGPGTGSLPAGVPPGPYPGSAQRATQSSPYGRMGYPGSPDTGTGRGLPRNVTIAPLAERMIVVAEPGYSPQGEAGTWLTVYRLDGVQLRKVSSMFHRPGPGSAGADPATGLPKPGAAPGGAGMGPSLTLPSAPGAAVPSPTPNAFPTKKPAGSSPSKR
jgi:hypothetical protein